MVEKRRKPGRPAYGSREKLIAATCALLAERGFEATAGGRPRKLHAGEVRADHAALRQG